jgi:hypothetical protein
VGVVVVLLEPGFLFFFFLPVGVVVVLVSGVGAVLVVASGVVAWVSGVGLVGAVPGVAEGSFDGGSGVVCIGVEGVVDGVVVEGVLGVVVVWASAAPLLRATAPTPARIVIPIFTYALPLVRRSAGVRKVNVPTRTRLHRPSRIRHGQREIRDQPQAIRGNSRRCPDIFANSS